MLPSAVLAQAYPNQSDYSPMSLHYGGIICLSICAYYTGICDPTCKNLT